MNIYDAGEAWEDEDIGNWEQKQLEEENEQRELERTGGGPGEGSGGDNGSAEGLSQPVFQIEVCRLGELLGRLPSGTEQEWTGGDPMPDDRSHRDLSGDDLIAFLGAVDAK